MKRAVLTTEKRGIEAISYSDMRELMHSAQLNFSPIYLRDGGILRRNGLCRMGQTPDGRVVLGFASDPNDFSLSPPRHHGGDVLKPYDADIYHPTLRQAQFLDRAGGFNKFHRIYGVYAKKNRTNEEWIIDQTRHFEQVRRQDFFDYGILCRVDNDTWLSKAVCYKRRPVMKRVKGKRVHLHNDKGEGLYNLYCTTAPGKGWDLAGLFDPSFDRRVPKLMGFASQKWRGIPESQVEPLVQRDVTFRVRRVMRGLDAYDLGVVDHYNMQTAGDRVFRYIGRHLIKLIHTSTFLNRNELTRLMLPLVFFAPMKKVAIAGTVLGKFVGYFLEKFNLDFTVHDSQNIVREFWPSNVKSQKIPDQYERLSPSSLLQIRWLDAQEANVKPDGATLYDSIPIDFAGVYILGIFNGPPGVEMTHYKVGKQNVLLAKQPNGLYVEYWPQSQTAFAVRVPSLKVQHDGTNFDSIRPLPKSVRDLLGHNEVVMVERLAQAGRVSVKPITRSAYSRIVRNLMRRKQNNPLAPLLNMAIIAKPAETRLSLRLKPVSYSPVAPGVVDAWQAEYEQVPLGRPRRRGLWARISGEKMTGSAAEEAVTEVGEGVIVGAVKAIALKLK